MIKLTHYTQLPLLHVKESALLNTPTNLSFKFDDSLHAKGVCSLDACQDTKKNPEQIILILQTVSEQQSTYRIILYLSISIFAFVFLITYKSHQVMRFILNLWVVCLGMCRLICQYCPFSSSFAQPLLRIIVRQTANVQKGHLLLWLKRALVIWPTAQRVIGGWSACQSGWVVF